MTEVWEVAQREFERLTGKQLQPTSAAALQSIRDQIEAGRSSKDPNVQKAKDAGLRIIKCIQLLGGVASQAASLVRSFPFHVCIEEMEG